ncbi:MAG: hypothetical protein LBF22_12415 [Deltaproteobacteria bacterium]|nr:hypothetical protein [Deltaproteobacteria bacterium]
MMFFLLIGYLTEKMRGNEGKLEKILKFLIPIFSFLLGFEGFTILLVLFLPLMLLFLVPILRPFEKLDFSKQSVIWEVLLWFGLSLIGYLILLFVIVPRGFGPEIPYTRYMMGFFYAVAGNIPSLLPSFIDETPLNAIKGRALVFTLNSIAAFAFLVFLFYLLYVFKTVLKKMDQLFFLPVRLLLTSLTLTLCLTLLFVVLAKFTIFFYFYILMVFIIVIYENYLENENIRLAKLLVFATAVLVILTSSANFKDFIRLSEENPARAVIQHSKTVEKIAKDFGISRMYAPLPDASPLEVLLSGNIKVGSLTSDLRPYVIGTSAERFAPSLTGERVAFVLPLKGKDIESYRKVEADPLLQLAKERVRIDDKTTPVDVFLFDKNPFTFSGRLAVFPELEGNLKDDESGPLQTFESEENDGKIIDNDALESQNNDSFIKY